MPKDTKKKVDSKKQDNKKQDSKNQKHFMKDFRAELKRVIWPTPKQLFNNTVAVITVVLITAAIVFALDLIFESVNTYGIEKLKEVVGTEETNIVDTNVVDTNTTDTNSVDTNAVDTNETDENSVNETADTNSTETNSVEE